MAINDWKGIRKRILSRLPWLTLEVLLVLVIFFGSAALVAFLVDEVFEDEQFIPDQYAFNILSGVVSPSMTAFMKFITFLGSAEFLVPAFLLLIGYAFFIEKNKWLGIKVASVGLSSLLLMFTLKLLFNRARPEFPLLGEVPGLSFPSGHALMSFSFYGLLAYFLWNEFSGRRVRYLLVTVSLLLILLIAASRVYLRVHYLSDVMAGLCLGAMWLIISLFVMHQVEKRANNRQAEA